MKALHPAFIERIEKESFPGRELLAALDTTVPVSIRKHPLKHTVHFDGEVAIPWCTNAFRLPERPLFTLEPLFHAGCFYPQEAGSMLLEHALKELELPANPFVLDLCAAPGGKSTLIASFLNGDGLLVSNEVIQQRSRILRENMSKWGYQNTVVTNNDPADFDRIPHFFDVVVVDAPCSGEGMFRKDEQARDEWSPEHVALCAGRQKRILADVWSTLRPDGYLIYSTCTFNAQENEENVHWLLEEMGGELIQLPVPNTFVRGRNEIGIYGIPGKSETEGFFLAVIRKTDDAHLRGPKLSSRMTRQKELSEVKELAALDASTVFNWQEQLLAVPANYEEAFLIVQQQLRIVKWGVNLGELSRKGVIPHQELALCPTLLRAERRIELGREDALRYLHGDTFPLAGEHGFTLITHEGESLGWIKHLGNRFNNLYPKEWRIRMAVS